MTSANATKLETAEAMMDNIGKLKVADHARLMGDNQATLERSNRSDEAHRDYTRRVREAQARKVFGENWEPPLPLKPGDDQMQIFIDSPITVSQPERTPQQQTTPPPSPPTPPPATAEQPKKNWLLPLALAGALGTGAAIPLAMDALRPDTTPAVTEPVEFELPQYDVERWVPE
jgi:hypothetical protein